ncbi:phospholipid/cholesterol/gamma-HCH transport system permease protein [Roseivivax marinus]|uniref:ABC transporter permease n=1 Tax=Roseivivax marinus TaxID=1379903 RepID=UPI0008D5DA97|nr:MlaE family lipid ABC transporter permease subunit [Roseivivax marinus]SEK90092.1 phospholipid/cholesterol/gamma-HCH transport system permease protein [Roseivivax marinus]
MQSPPRPTIDVTHSGTRTEISVAGDLDVAALPRVDRALAEVPADRPARADLSEVARLDTAGAFALLRLRARLEAAGQGLEIAGADARMQAVLETVERSMPEKVDAVPARRSLKDRVEGVGRAVADAGQMSLELLNMFGMILARLGRVIVRPGELRVTALVHHAEAVGFQAVPIVALMSFLIGIVLAFQGAVQLRQFGAEVFVVDLLGISILRELGVLLTSIIVAGRTASSFTAAIGSMKMREEIDAMRTLGLDPAAMLFLPRVLALLLMLPILALIADAAGLIGGAIMAWAVLDISPPMFATRLVEGTDVANLIIGIGKAPVFALIIGVVGCHAGMRVRGNAESLGRQTSASVVTAIFAVIVADAVFSVLLAEVGV